MAFLWETTRYEAFGITPPDHQKTWPPNHHRFKETPPPGLKVRLHLDTFVQFQYPWAKEDFYFCERNAECPKVAEHITLSRTCKTLKVKRNFQLEIIWKRLPLRVAAKHVGEHARVWFALPRRTNFRRGGKLKGMWSDARGFHLNPGKSFPNFSWWMTHKELDLHPTVVSGVIVLREPTSGCEE